jgi:chemotaxis response regulator CheB
MPGTGTSGVWSSKDPAGSVFEYHQQKNMAGNDLYAVGIGSSAGGLPALSSFLKNVRQHVDTAYVIVQHLGIDQESKLAAILGKDTTVPVKEIEKNEKIRGGTVFVMPAGYKLRLENGVFKLDPRPETEVVNRAINYFFTSLAREMKSKAFGVILSGTGTDGVEGVKEIERLGGIVIVQDPETAQFDGMPENTIYKDHPDYVINPEAMPALIAGLQQDKNSNQETRRNYH